MPDDRRLIEDYLPIEAISAEASREKSVRKGHISTLHLWWARRPLVACRAAVYGALVPASQFVPNGGSDAQKKSLGRANAAKFVKNLCQYPGSSHVIQEAQQHILKAHADRLTQELRSSRREEAHSSKPEVRNPKSEIDQNPVTSAGTPAWVKEFKFNGNTVTVEDILAGRAPRPRVLDMFAGGGAIPLEALRLGCEAYALDLNPVAHIIQLCTLVYPQKFGKPDAAARGMTGPKNDKGETTWGGLAEEVRHWGNWVLEKVRAEIGDLYPPIPDPEFEGHQKPRKGGKIEAFEPPQKTMEFAADPQMTLSRAGQSAGGNRKSEIPPGYLTPVAYLWTRTVQCKNPGCGATVPLVKQTWLCKKEDRYVALRMVAPKGQKRVRFEVVEARSAAGLGFDPEAFSKRGNATCPFCGTVADVEYVKAEGTAKRIGHQAMAIVCTHKDRVGKVYLPVCDGLVSEPEERQILRRIAALTAQTGLTIPNEPLPPAGTLGFRVQPYGLLTWGDLFLPRQLLCLLSFAASIRDASRHIIEQTGDSERVKAVSTYLGLAVDRVAMFGNSLCAWYYQEQAVSGTFSRQALPILWDFAEVSLQADISGGIAGGIGRIVDTIEMVCDISQSGEVIRQAAQNCSSVLQDLDAVITDPPYYDNIPYADLSDFFYVWLKRTVGPLYPEHFASPTTPKKNEAIAEPVRHGGSKAAAKSAYEAMMLASFCEAWRVLKPNGSFVVVYAHKTTLGWSTLVEALRGAKFTVTEAWPMDTEGPGRLRAHDSAALATSIFLVARKRDSTATGDYDEQVRPELESIVRERVETLWDMGISGADLVIASVGAGLRAFTRFARVEYANGEEVPAERFLTEVETVVLETILARLSKEVGGKGGTSLAGLDPASRFYILWRYTYGAAELDAGEAIIFANGTHVELDGQHSLTGGRDALVEKKKSKYRLRDFAERGDDDKLGLPTESGASVPLVDQLHRLLWLMEKRPGELRQFLRDAQPNREALRLVAQALAGPALKGGELGDISPTAELSALGKLTANWQSVIEDAAQTTGEKEEKKVGQKQLI